MYKVHINPHHEASWNSRASQSELRVVRWQANPCGNEISKTLTAWPLLDTFCRILCEGYRMLLNSRRFLNKKGGDLQWHIQRGISMKVGHLHSPAPAFRALWHSQNQIWRQILRGYQGVRYYSQLCKLAKSPNSEAESSVFSTISLVWERAGFDSNFRHTSRIATGWHILHHFEHVSSTRLQRSRPLLH